MTPEKPARRLTIGLQGLSHATEDHSGWWTWLLDLETGELVHLSEDPDLEQEFEFHEAIEDDPDRYAWGSTRSTSISGAGAEPTGLEE